jgi:hypothetical protein
VGKIRKIPDPTIRPTIPLQEAFTLLGISRATGYQQVHQGTFPVPVLRLGRNFKVPTAKLLDLLGLHAPAGTGRPDADPPRPAAA